MKKILLLVVTSIAVALNAMATTDGQTYPEVSIADVNAVIDLILNA